MSVRAVKESLTTELIRIPYRLRPAIAAACALALIAAATGAGAAEPAAAPPQADCEAVRRHVAEHGRARALAWAIENGFTWGQIRAARRCLTGVRDGRP